MSKGPPTPVPQPTPPPAPAALSHDLLDAEEARLVLNMPQAKFELLVSSGQLPIFRSEGRTCFRREDITAIALKRKAAQSKPAVRSVAPVSAAKKEAPAAEAAKKERDKYAVTRQTLPAMKPKPKSSASLERIDAADEQADREDDDRPTAVPAAKRGLPVWLLAGAAAVVILFASWTFMSTRQNSNQLSHGPTPNLNTFANSKAAPGLVEAVSGERPLSFEVGGKIRAVFVDEGQRVKIGDVIAELENTDLTAKVKSSEADLSAAKARLGILKGNLESDLKKAESEVDRLKAELLLLEPRQEDIDQADADAKAAGFDANLAAEEAERYFDASGQYKSWPKQLYDQALRKSQSAKAHADSASAHMRALKSGSRPEEKNRVKALLASAEAEVARQNATSAFQVQSAQAQVDQTSAQVELAKADLQKTRIVSNIEGTVVRKFMHPGEVIDVLHPQPVVTMADLTQLRVRADVDEADFPSIQIGQKVKITADALEDGKFFTGTVEQVSYITGQKRFSTGEARERMDVKIVETIVKFDAPPPAKMVKLGLRVTTFFEVHP